jgi:hypothetical protein
MVLYDYLAAVFFIVFAVFVGGSFILASKLIGKRTTANEIKTSPYESAEHSIGRSKDIDTEYMPFFMIFLPFEIVGVVTLLWGIGAKQTPYAIDIGMLGVLFSATLLAVLGYRLITDARR